MFVSFTHQIIHDTTFYNTMLLMCFRSTNVQPTCKLQLIYLHFKNITYYHLKITHDKIHEVILWAWVYPILKSQFLEVLVYWGATSAMSNLHRIYNLVHDNLNSLLTSKSMSGYGISNNQIIQEVKHGKWSTIIT